MDLSIKTKYNIGQEVYIPKKDIVFYKGSFINTLIPDTTPYKIVSIKIRIQSTLTIYYYLNNKQDAIIEDKVFESLESLEKYCDDSE